MHTDPDDSSQAAARIQQLERHILQLQQEANTAGALEYRFEGLQQEKQQLTQQLQQLKGNVVQMQSTLHQERLLRQEGEITAAQIGAEKLQLQARLVDLEAKLQVAEQRALEAEEEQLETVQELAAVTTELKSARRSPQAQDSTSQSQASQPLTVSLHHELHAAQMRADDLRISLASTESALASAQLELASATERITQLQQSVSGQMHMDNGNQAGVSGQSYPNGVSQLPTGRKAGSGQLPSGLEPSSSQSLSEDAGQHVQRLRAQVTSLKASRDKLLVEVDRQSLEIERLLTDNTALEQGLAHMQESVQIWEAQAQENLQHMDQLKALLEESAFWHSEQTGAPQNAHTGTLAHHAPTEAQLHMEVLQEKARVTGLEVQVRALCFELARARENAGLLSQSIAPTLGSIGSRLAQLLQVNAVQQAAR